MTPKLLPAALILIACNTHHDQGAVDAPLVPPGGDGHDAPSGVTDPGNDGPAAVSIHDASIPGATAGRVVPATVYVPSGSGPFPLVVISPGFQMQRAQYASFAHHLATWQFVAVLTDYADTSFFADHQKLADDVPAIIDYAIAHEAVDVTKVALAGHSLGGDISVLAAIGDHRVGAVVGWDPVDASNPAVVPMMGGMQAALAVIGETTDGSGGFMPCAPTAQNFTTFYGAAAAPAVQMTVADADHMDWVDDPTCSLCSFCTAGAAPDERARLATRRLNVAWLHDRLLGDAQFMTWLATTADVALTTK